MNKWIIAAALLITALFVAIGIATVARSIWCAIKSASCHLGGHKWKSFGGRACPFDLDNNCSQPVYRCVRCGTHDYGTGGGPGWDSCIENCASGLGFLLMEHKKDCG